MCYFIVHKNKHLYRPQTKFGTRKYFQKRVSRILFTGGTACSRGVACSRGCLLQGGGRVTPPWWLLQLAVRILPECILVWIWIWIEFANVTKISGINLSQQKCSVHNLVRDLVHPPEKNVWIIFLPDSNIGLFQQGNSYKLVTGALSHKI